MPKFNPFRPGAIIHPGMFYGRNTELIALEQALFQTANGNPAHFLIHGERGIGKSSLLLLVSSVATGAIASYEEQRHKFLTVNVELEPRDDYRELVLKIAREFQRALDKESSLQKNLRQVWDFISKWKVLGVEFKRDTTVPENALVEELVEKFVAVAKNMGDDWQGIYVFMDEADKAPAEAGLGEFVKIFTERLTRREANNVGLGIVGISSVLQKMRDSHESSVRIFEPLLLKPLDPADRMGVVKQGLKEANRINPVAVTIDNEALKMISELSEGYPHFIQQYAYSAFEQDSDNNIDVHDVEAALNKENGALQILGQRYFENMYTEDLRSDDYRTVLQFMASQMPAYVTARQIVQSTGLKQHTVNNALGACKSRGSVVLKPGQKAGQYRLTSMSFATWIRAFKT